MKKSLSVLVATAMVSSIFASVAYADDTLTTQQKLDALIAAGVFDKDGTGNGPELDANMSREQLAKILFKLKGLTEVSGTSYTDVASDRWSAGFIQAVSKTTPPLMDGVATGVFDPAGDVTLEQLATVAVRALGLQTSSSATVQGNVSDWAKGYVAAAIANGLLSQKTDYTKPAIRSELVEAAYTAQQVIIDSQKPAQVSVKEAKATGVKTVTVTLDRDVDTSKATLTLKRGSTTIATKTAWSQDKKSATLTLSDTTIKEGEYTVTLGGLDASSIKTANGTFTAQNEKVEKIEFVNANDTIAHATNAVVKIKASNQYGEIASASAGSYNTFGGVTKLTKDQDGYLLATVNTSGQTKGVGIVTLTIMNTESYVTATKNFKVGVEPLLSKLELGAPKYSNGTAISGSGDNVKFTLNMYDQYGGTLGYDALKVGTGDELKTNLLWNSYLEGAQYVVEDDGQNVPVLKISLSKNVDKDGDYSFTVVNSAAYASGKISIKSAKIATKIEIGEPEGDVIAAGDTDVYVPVIAYDAQGNQLSIDDLVSDANINRITVSATGASSSRLEATGQHRGKIKLDTIPNVKGGVVNINAFIATANVQSNANKQFTVQPARYPDFIREITAPGKQIAPGGITNLRYALIDQYGKQMKEVLVSDNQGHIDPNGNVYRVAVKAVTYAPVYANGVITGYTEVPVTKDTTTLAQSLAHVQTSDTVLETNKAAFDATAKQYGPNVDTGFGATTYRIAAKNDINAKDYKVEFTVQLLKNGQEVSKVTRTVNVVQPTSSDLTFALNSVPALWNAKDAGNYSVTDQVYVSAFGGAIENFSRNDQLAANGKFGREVIVSAKNGAGEAVGLPKQIVSIVPADSSIVNTSVVKQANGDTKGYVVGVKPGTTKIGVNFIAPDGQTKYVETQVTVKGDTLGVTKLAWGAKAYNRNQTATDANGEATFRAFTNLTITDNYGVTYTNDVAQKHNYLLGVTFAVTNVSGGTVVVDQYGNVKVTKTGTGAVVFDLTANHPAGHSVTTTITSNISR